MSQEFLVSEELLRLMGDNKCEGHSRTPEKMTYFMTQKTVPTRILNG